MSPPQRSQPRGTGRGRRARAQHPGLRPRPAQQDLAAAIADAFDSRGTLLAEAGTGTGKTFAYLVPALLSGKKTIVSTGTRALQDQLYHRDLPRVRDALGVGLKTALLKGRANYLCQYRHAPGAGRAALRHARTGRAVPAHRRLVRAHAHGRPGRTRRAAGRLAAAADGHLHRRELPGQRMPVLRRLLRRAGAPARAGGRPGRGQPPPAAGRPGAQAGRLRRNPARRAGLRRRRGAPAAGAGRAVLRRSLECAAAGRAGPRRADRMQGKCRRALAAVQEPARALEQSVRALRAAMDELPVRGTRRRAAEEPAVEDAFDALADALRQLHAVLQPLASASPGFDACAARAVEFEGRLQRWRDDSAETGADEDDEFADDFADVDAGAGDTAADAEAESDAAKKKRDDGSVLWYELTARGFRLSRTPLDVAGPLRAAPRAFAGGVDIHLGHARGRRPFRALRDQARPVLKGDDPPQTLLVPSPFDWEKQALCYLPRGLPEPAVRHYNESMVEKIAAGAGGLAAAAPSCCSPRIARCARPPNCSAAGRGRCSCRAKRRDRCCSSASAPPATACCWARRVSARASTSPAMRCSVVVIDKLPFAAPDDPVFEARLDAIRRNGGNPFRDEQLPQAVIALKQGAGRLIRNETDRGVLVLCDPRLTGKTYGSVFLNSLPPLPKTRGVEDVQAFFAPTTLEVEPTMAWRRKRTRINQAMGAASAATALSMTGRLKPLTRGTPYMACIALISAHPGAMNLLAFETATEALLGRPVDRRRRCASASSWRRAAMPSWPCRGRTSCWRRPASPARSSTPSPSGAGRVPLPACAWRSRSRRASRWRWIGRWCRCRRWRHWRCVRHCPALERGQGCQSAGRDRRAHGRGLCRRIRVARWRCPSRSMRKRVARPTRSRCRRRRSQWLGVGTGFAAADGVLSQAPCRPLALRSTRPQLPHAADVARLAAHAFARGEAIAAERVEPAYLRNNVALTLSEQQALRDSR